MQTILFLPFHGFGHFYGLFGFARELEKTHNVIFAANGYFHRHVTSRGLQFRTLSSYPFGIGLEKWIHETILKSKHPLWRNIVDRWTDRLYHERVAELTKVLEEYKPVHVLVDAQQATDVIVLKTIDPNLKISLVSTSLPYLLMPGLPPINSTAMPGDSDAAYKKELSVIKRRVWRQKKKYFGMDDRYMIDRRLRRNKLKHLKDIYPSLITFAAKDVDQYVLGYREFDFHHEYLDRFHYVGSHPDITEIKPIERSKKNLVYCSFGTVPSEKNVKAFIKKVEDACAALDCDLIVGSVTNWVDQHSVLNEADVFITHGGINSIYDAIRFKVPMIVYPVDSNYDQNGNSSRVVYHGLGLRGDFDLDTEDDVRNKLKDVLENRSKFKTLDVSGYSVEDLVRKLVAYTNKK